MTRKGNDRQVGNSSTRATGYILHNLKKTGLEFCFTNYYLEYTPTPPPPATALNPAAVGYTLFQIHKVVGG